MSKRYLYFSLCLVLALVVQLNLISDRFYFRLDLTEDNRYTLSPLTRQTLDSLHLPVTITAYFSEDLPTEFLPLRNDLRDLLLEYQNASREMVAFEFQDPAADPEREAAIEKLGVTPIPVPTREEDKMVLRKVYLSVLVQMGERHEIIPLLKPGSSIEFALSRAIIKLTRTRRQQIGLVQGHGEAVPASIPQALSELSVQYDVHPVHLDSLAVDTYRTLVMLHPGDSIPMHHYQFLDRFLASGGRLFVALSRVQADFGRAEGYEVNRVPAAWLRTKGIFLPSAFVLDQHCGFIRVLQQTDSPRPVETRMDFPYFPVITKFSDHPVSQGMESVVLQLASPIYFRGDTLVRYTPLLHTSARTAIQPAPIRFSAGKEWTDRDFNAPPAVVAAAFEGPMGGSASARMVLVTNGSFPGNGVGDAAEEVIPDNIHLLTYSVDWLSDETGLTGLRSRTLPDRWLTPGTPGFRTLIKWANFLFPMLLMMSYGVFRWYRIRKRMTSVMN
jgi:gliding-associated putative ABC transporter substrate-binding component GldG